MRSTFEVSEMTCEHCVEKVKQALAQLPLMGARISLGMVEVEHDSDEIAADDIIAAIEASGYPVVRE
jgi:copper chaperone CopZ